VLRDIYGYSRQPKIFTEREIYLVRNNLFLVISGTYKRHALDVFIFFLVQLWKYLHYSRNKTLAGAIGLFFPQIF